MHSKANAKCSFPAFICAAILDFLTGRQRTGKLIRSSKSWTKPFGIQCTETVHELRYLSDVKTVSTVAIKLLRC